MKNAVRYILLGLIALLALASITNIHARTEQLHADAGWQSWVVSGGFAIGFAVFAFLLVSARGWAARIFYFGCTMFAATLTGVAQTGMYLFIGSDWWTALTYGCGAPALEALFAISVHFDESEQPGKKTVSSGAWNRLLNAAVSRIERPADASRNASVDALHNTESDASCDKEVDAQRNTKRNKATARQEELLSILRDEFNGSPTDALNKTELGTRLGTTRQTVGRDLEALEQANRIVLNGHIQVRGDL